MVYLFFFIDIILKILLLIIIIFMKKFISAIVVFFVLLSSTFSYEPTIKDETILQNVYTKIDKVGLSTFHKLYKQISKLKIKYNDKPQVYYLLSELENYLKIKIDENKLYKVLDVSDGDTIKIDYDWEEAKIRFIWIDTPESFVTRYWYKECYWDEASNYLKKLLNWKKVSIEFDESQDKIDKYWRLLVYVFLDWENINAKLIKEWYAFEYTYITAYKYQDEFKKYEKESKELVKGLWNENTCNWERKSVTGEITTDWTSIKYYNPNNLDYLNMWFTCEKTKYCKYMSSCEEVSYYYNVCWAKTFDWDKDWIPCENMCWVEIKYE